MLVVVKVLGSTEHSEDIQTYGEDQGIEDQMAYELQKREVVALGELLPFAKEKSDQSAREKTYFKPSSMS